MIIDKNIARMLTELVYIVFGLFVLTYILMKKRK
jgi:hypothetical protein